MVDPLAPQPEVIRAAAAAVRAGGVVVFPTSGLYGLGADPFDAAAVQRLFTLKRRRADQPILVLVAAASTLARLLTEVPPAGRAIMEHFWPGGVTVICRAREGLPRGLTAGSGKLGVRLARHPVAVALIEAVGGAVTGTSANLSGAPGCRRIDDIDPQLAADVDLLLDAGELPGGSGSTIVDVSVTPPRILREGAVSARAIRSVC